MRVITTTVCSFPLVFLMLSVLGTSTNRLTHGFLVNNNLQSSIRSLHRTHMIGSILDILGGGEPNMVTPDKALKGRSQAMPNIEGSRHAVLGTKVTDLPPGHEQVLLANGCFWGSEKGFWRLPGNGIHSTTVGYCGGFTPNPSYEEVCSGQTGHTEGVRVVYDPTQIALTDILRWFWEAHDPTQGMGQGNDRGTQYRSGMYYFNDEQRQLMQASQQAYEKALGRPITTDCEAATASSDSKEGVVWYYAESYHQQYLAKPGARPYCSAQPQGVPLPSYESWSPFAKDDDLYTKNMPVLPESFWKKHAPRKGCSVVQEPNEPIGNIQG